MGEQNFNKRIFALFEMVGLIIMILILTLVSMTYLTKTNASDDDLRKKIEKIDKHFESLAIEKDDWDNLTEGAGLDIELEDDEDEEKQDDKTNEDDEKKDEDQKNKEDISAEVTAEGLNVRKEPTTNSEIVDVLSTGAIVKLTGETKESGGYEWTKIETPNGSIGWVVSNYLK